MHSIGAALAFCCCPARHMLLLCAPFLNVLCPAAAIVKHYLPLSAFAVMHYIYTRGSRLLSCLRRDHVPTSGGAGLSSTRAHRPNSRTARRVREASQHMMSLSIDSEAGVTHPPSNASHRPPSLSASRASCADTIHMPASFITPASHLQLTSNSPEGRESHDQRRHAMAPVARLVCHGRKHGSATDTKRQRQWRGFAVIDIRAILHDVHLGI